MALSDKQQVFVAQYLKCWNASEAARRAGYKGKANVIGPRLLANVSISEEIEARKAELMMSADEALARLTEQARAAYSAYFNENGDVNIAQMVADGKGHLIKGKKPTQYGDVIEFHDAQTALLNVGKQHGLFSDQHVVTVKLEKEIDAILDVAKQVLSPDAYGNLLARLSGETGSTAALPTDQTE